ncbi:hypothetical protein CRENBAI_008640 [Crenichthys baileyi]|uniref:PX domain-containing protein n=1 Tax=Crenichthys baileyi TaxID=28760 RepID=A0AAV9RML6_9TELE
MLDLDEDEDLEVFSKNTSLAEGSPMPNSPDSMVNQFRLDEEEQQDAINKEIFITVDNPESHITAIETFVMYRVVTKTTRSEFDSSEYEVRRRYQDFLWLKSRLEENYPTLIVHPLPEKFVMKGMVDRFNDDFIETRRKALHRFLNRISEHPILSNSHHFKVFLTEEVSPTHIHVHAHTDVRRMRSGDVVAVVGNSLLKSFADPLEINGKTHPESFDCFNELFVKQVQEKKIARPWSQKPSKLHKRKEGNGDLGSPIVGTTMDASLLRHIANITPLWLEGSVVEGESAAAEGYDDEQEDDEEEEEEEDDEGEEDEATEEKKRKKKR